MNGKKEISHRCSTPMGIFFINISRMNKLLLGYISLL
nr:MAG TPA: hypothetical protein [Caudoviricetes sp.]